MSVDTSDIDKQITDLTAQVETAQAAFDNDPFTAALKNHQDLASSLNVLQMQLGELQSKRDQLVSLDSQITDLTAKLTTLQTAVSAKSLGVDQQAQRV